MKTAIESLSEAFIASDDRRRPERIQRVVWLADHAHLPPAIIGRTETLYLLSEAREVFIDGYYISALLLAISVINHALVEELQLRSDIEGDPGLKKVLARSEVLGVLPAEWFAPIRQLVSRRHPFVHFKETEDPVVPEGEKKPELERDHGLGERVMKEKMHPVDLLEQDARDAMMFMYRVFRATLHGAA